MTITVYPKENAFRNDAAALLLLERLRENETVWAINDALIFCKFPLFKEEGDVLSVKFAVISRNHGVMLISTSEEANDISHDSTVRELDSTFSQVFSRLVKYPRLRTHKTNLAFNLDSFLFLSERQNNHQVDGEDVVVGFPALSNRININRLQTEISKEVFDELISVLDGSKALLRPQIRETAPYGDNTKIAQIAALEEEIRKFDSESPRVSWRLFGLS